MRKIAFAVAVILIIPLGGLAGGYAGALYAQRLGQPSEEWRLLGAPPAQVVQISGFCQHQICVTTSNGLLYRFNPNDCDQLAISDCWFTADATELKLAAPIRYNVCMYDFQFPSPPSDTIQMLGVKDCGSGGDYYESYALLEDGTIWKWDYSFGDMGGAVSLYFGAQGIVVGLLVGALIALGLFATMWARVSPTRSEA